MISNYTVKQRGLLWFWRAITIWWPCRKRPTIYLPPSEKAMSRRLMHERVHARQWMELGRVRFVWRYLTPSGCLDLEAEAFAQEVKWHTERGSYDAGYGRTYIEYYADVMRRGYPQIRWFYSQEEVEDRLAHYCALTRW